MRPTRLLPRLALAACLALPAVSLTGCEDENDPKTWVSKLDTTQKRPAAMRRLRQIWETRMAMTSPPNNVRDPQMQAFINQVVPQVAQAFIDHREELATRKEAIEILAACEDPRAVPALLAALEYSPGNSESERIAQRAARSLRDMHPQSPAAVTRLLATIDRASGNAGSAPSIREAVIQALGAIGDPAAADTLVRVLRRPIDQQEIRTARAAADALGTIGKNHEAVRNNTAVADALIYGLFLNVRRANAFNNCSRALVNLGPDAAVPRLVATVQGQNPDVAALLLSYASVPGVQPPPPGFQQATAIDVLRNFADARAIDALLAVLRDREQQGNTRGAAAETLAYTGLTLPANDPRRGAIFDALSAVFRESPAGSPTDMAPTVAPGIVLLGDPRAVDLLAQRVSARELASPDSVAFRLSLLMPLASAVRHESFATFDRLAGVAQQDLDRLLREHPDAADDINPRLRELQTIRQVASVAHDCADGDIACYQAKLADPERNVIRKAAYMIAWTGGENPGARAALLQRADNPDPLVRRSINIAIDSLSPHGCPECITRLESVIAAEAGQESKSVMHLEAQMLCARLRARR